MLERNTAVSEGAHRAVHHFTEQGSLFILPTWIALSQDSPAVPEALRVYLRSRSGRHVLTVNGSWSRARLSGVQLAPRAPAAWRRTRIVQSARLIQQTRGEVVGAPSEVSWVQIMAKNPAVVEDEAIRVWLLFLETANPPRGLTIPGFEATLADLLMVTRGVKNGRDRRWFANQWPAVVSRLCHEGDAVREYRRIEQNRAAAVRVASRLVCCQGDAECRKAARFARRLPRYGGDMRINRLLAGDDAAIRWLVVNVDHEDNGDLLRRIAREPAHAREQMEFVLAAMRALHCRAFDHDRGLYAAGALLARVFAGTGWNPARLDPGVVGRGLIAVSADCLAAFVAERRPDRQPEEASSLEAGVVALVGLLDGAPPRLTPKQLFRFLEHADSHSVHQVRSVGSQLPQAWPAPAGWTDVGQAPVSGDARIVPLLDCGVVQAEGKAMSNCLRDSTFMRMALLTGRKALFSVRLAGDRATLSLAATERREASTIHVESWKIDALRGPRNSPAATSCEEAARALVERLNRPLPVALSSAELQRRREILSRVAGRHSFNADLIAASTRWKRYVRQLPKRFRSMEASSVVDGVVRERGT